MRECGHHCPPPPARQPKPRRIGPLAYRRLTSRNISLIYTSSMFTRNFRSFTKLPLWNCSAAGTCLTMSIFVSSLLRLRAQKYRWRCKLSDFRELISGSIPIQRWPPPAHPHSPTSGHVLRGGPVYEHRWPAASAWRDVDGWRQLHGTCQGHSGQHIRAEPTQHLSGTAVAWIP